MAWTGLTLTVSGRDVLNKAQISNKMNIKSIVVGDGTAPANFNTMKGLVHQLYEITEVKIDIVDGGCSITADFPVLDYDYYFREIGVLVTTDNGDVLYVYDNCGNDAQYIVSSTGIEKNKKRLNLKLLISDVSEITVSNPSILYVDYDDFEKAIETLEQEKLSLDGNASNVTVSFNQAAELTNIASGEKLSVIFGKIAKYFTDLKTVAFTGSYSDLTNKPTIPSALKNPYSLKTNGKTYDGSEAVDVETIGIAYGGTGATTAAAARTNLGLDKVPNVATNDQTPTFTAASTRANIASGEKLSVIFGKIAKYFTDLKTVAFSGSYNDLTNKPAALKNPNALKANGKTYDGSAAVDMGTVGLAYGGTGATTAAAARTNLGLGTAATQGVANNLITTAAGYALDARQGKALKDEITELNGSLNTKLDKNKVNLLNKAKGIGIDVVSEDYGNSTQCLAIIELLTQQDGSGKYVLEIWNNNLVCFYIDNNGWHRLWNMR